MSSWAASSSDDQSSVSALQVQAKALEEILGVLLSAGYFRARVASLTAFDKVVGGLCWCITSSGAAVEVDLSYDEDLQLGKKIELSEAIVKVLRAMGCPAPLQAHQVQGGDFAAIFPVMRWLVAKVLDYRRITGDYVRLASETAFERAYVPFAASDAGAASSPAVLAAVLRLGAASGADVAATVRALRSDAERAGDAFAAEVRTRYRPVRRFRRQVSLKAGGGGLPPAMSAEARVQSCLLEFGERTVVKAVAVADDLGDGDGGGAPQAPQAGRVGGAKVVGPGAASSSASPAPASSLSASSSSSAAPATEFERKFAAVQQRARAEDEEKRRQAVAAEQQLMQGMTEVAGGGRSTGVAVSGQNVGALVGLQAEALRRAAEEYGRQEEQRRVLAESGEMLANTKQGRAAAHARRVAALQRRAEAAGEARAEQQQLLGAIEAELAQLREALAKAERYNGRATAEIAKLDAQVLALPAPQQEQFRRLAALHARSEGLREQEQGFKAACKQQLRELTALLEGLRGDAAGGGEAAARLSELERLHAETLARFERARAALAVRGREVARLARLIDDVPARPELVQYERRFLELFDEVSERLDETRKYYTLYSTMDKKRGFLLKEDALVASVSSNFAASMKGGAKTQKVYLDQIGQVTVGVEAALAQQERATDAKMAARDSRAADVQALVDAQRAYFRAVAELTREAEINEGLQRAAAAQ